MTLPNVDPVVEQNDHRREIMDPFLSIDEIASSLKGLNKMAKRPPVDIEFEDITYTVKHFTGGHKQILKGVSGKFRSGELTAIIGPSGAGKSTLLNVLVGYSTVGVGGSILVNGQQREMGLYHKLSCYIMQDDLVQPWITVQEAMEVAAHLKLGNELKPAEKRLVVEEVLSTLGLTSCRNTRTENLSGGQRRRLSVALELVSNPPLIFLDEPTSGLDVVSIKQCISLLKILANHGRTIVCTIHQPSASIFSLFDNVYVVTRGRCVYQGASNLLVPFLNEVGLFCPKTHNPADFILESVQSNMAHINTMCNQIRNGKVCRTVVPIETKKKSDDLDSEDWSKLTSLSITFPTSFWTQFTIILGRMFKQKFRNTTSLWISLMHHIVSGTLVGFIFLGIGNNGEIPIANFKFCICVLVFFMYTHIMAPILLYPMELQYLKREYFNRWYGLKSYYAALTVSNVPLIILFGFIFLGITYIMSGQLLEIKRFALFSLASILTGLCSEAFGLTIGCIFKSQNGAILGPCFSALSLAIAVYGMGFGPYIEMVMHILMRSTYLRFGVIGMATSLYQNRKNLDCTQVYCHYSDPQILLRDLGMSDINFYLEMLGLVGFTVAYRLAAYLALRFKLQSDVSLNILYRVSNFLRRKRS